MYKILVRILWGIVIILVVGILIAYNLFFANARTVYSGYVEIEPITLDELKNKISNTPCKVGEYLPDHLMYSESDTRGEKSLAISPHGPGMGPSGFVIINNRLESSQDISGRPDIEKYKAKVRQELRTACNIVTIKEETWKLIRTEYPFNGVY